MCFKQNLQAGFRGSRIASDSIAVGFSYPGMGCFKNRASRAFKREINA